MNTHSSRSAEVEKMHKALSAGDMAKILSTSKATIYRMVEREAIPYFRIGGLVRFDPQVIAEWRRRTDVWSTVRRYDWDSQLAHKDYRAKAS